MKTISIVTPNGTRIADGYYSWELTHVRKIQKPIPIPAKRGLYETDFSPQIGFQ